PAATLDEADTRQRTRKAPPRPSPPPQPAAGFGDDAPEPTVSARPQQQQQQQQQPAAQPHRPPSQKVQPLAAPAPQASSAASTLQMPPSQNPLSTPKPSVRMSFDEPTRIPPAQPPPLDSGRFVPGLDESDALSFGSPLGEPEPTLRPRSNRGVYVALGILGLVAIGGVAAVTLAGGGDGRGTLSIVSLPPGAEVRIDGVGGSQQTPLTLPDVDPRASHHVRVSRSGYDVWESDVKFPPGEHELRVQLVLVPTVGTVEIASTPSGAEAIVNGRIRGLTPTTVGDLPPNDDVVIELRLRGYKVAHKTVSWAGKRIVQVTIPLEKAK
ncbi:MAG: S-layer-like protein, partial [bacterium]|nr:S-layer-like protein [bacterium]